jgi:lysyl-tRNA synthetase class 2
VNPLEVERFEAYVCGMEFCNAFSELNDPIDQLQRFIDENYRAALGDDEAHPIDEDFIEALTYGMPPAGGFGMGVDRITMIFANKSTIREVLLFPHLRAIKEEDEAADEDGA